MFNRLMLVVISVVVTSYFMSSKVYSSEIGDNNVDVYHCIQQSQGITFDQSLVVFERVMLDETYVGDTEVIGCVKEFEGTTYEDVQSVVMLNTVSQQPINQQEIDGSLSRQMIINNVDSDSWTMDESDMDTLLSSIKDSEFYVEMVSFFDSIMDSSTE